MSQPIPIDDELEANVASLTLDEATQELLECSRYGELECVDALLRHFGKATIGERKVSFVDTTDSAGSTALHKAACNGHLEVVRLLIDSGSKHVANNNGNTPLHWASGASHVDVVKLLLERFESDGIDVLQKNKFGKSALTEGFSGGYNKAIKTKTNASSAKTDNKENKDISGVDDDDDDDDDEKTKTVGALLEHNTASEDRLIGKSVNNEKDSIDNNGVTHELALVTEGADSHTLLVRELPIAHADNPFGNNDNPADDTTGLGIWCASLAMSRWLASKEMCSRFSGKTLCELGAGCGVPSLASAFYSSLHEVAPPKKIYLTDLNEGTMANLKHNIDLNGERCPGINVDQWNSMMQALTMDWSDKSSWPAECESIDFVIGSDLIYQKEIVPILVQVVKGLLVRGENSTCGPKSFLYVAPDTGRDGLPEFIKTMKKEGFRCVADKLAPDEYLANPLKSGDNDECFLHFGELSSTTYILYEFRKK